MFSKSRQLGDIKEGQDYKISYVGSLKVSQKKSPPKVNSARLFFGDWDRFSASFNKRQERQKRKQRETEMAATAEH